MSLIESIKEFDTRLFLFFNGKHNPFFDSVMLWASDRYFWIPLYIVFFLLVLKYFKKNSWLVILAVIVLAICSDQITVHAFKNVFLRYRPCYNLSLASTIHVNGDCGGTYGFISSHAANTFALAMFLFLLFRSRIRYIGWLVFSWATLVSYSRIYNGVHYPADVAVGAIVGMGVASAVFQLYKKCEKKFIVQA